MNIVVDVFAKRLAELRKDLIPHADIFQSKTLTVDEGDALVLNVSEKATYLAFSSVELHELMSKIPGLENTMNTLDGYNHLRTLLNDTYNDFINLNPELKGQLEIVFRYTDRNVLSNYVFTIYSKPPLYDLSQAGQVRYFTTMCVLASMVVTKLKQLATRNKPLSIEEEFDQHKDYIIKLIEHSGLSAPINLDSVNFNTITTLMRNLIDDYSGETPYGHPATSFNSDGSLT